MNVFLFIFAGATKSTTSDYDDDAKIKQQQQQKMQQQQHQQQQQQLKTTKKDKKDIQTLAATDRNSSSSSSSRETQSRNPIRRSQSERQPTTTYHNNNSSNNGSSNNGSNNNGFNYKNRKNGNSNGGGPTDGSSSNLNENIISNTRNRLKDIENIPNIKNGNFTANIDGSKRGGGGSVGVSGGASVKANKTLVNFQDTMALRNRYNRNDTRDLFAMSLIGRPREPPPPPPTSPSTLSSSSSSSSSSPSPLSCSKPTTPLSNSLLKAKDLKDTTKSITLATDAIESCQQHQQQIVVKGLENQQQEQHELQLTIGHELKPQLHTNTDKIFSKEINGATLNQDTKVVVQQMVVGTKSITTTQLTNGKITTTTDILSTRDNIKANKELITMTSPRNNQQQQQKTVVRVAPFNKNSSEVHRLKISHTDHHMDEQMAPNTPNTPNSVSSNNSSFNSSHYSVTDLSTLDSSHDYGQKKTSILINGDDCYSTMNLSCNDSSMPLYQSSVVVTDGTSHCQQKMEGLKVTNSNYNTVTINVSSPRSSEDELILQHNQLNNLLKRQSKSSLHSGSIRAIIPIRGTIDINLQRSASSTSSTSTSSLTSTSSSTSSASAANQTSRGKTLIRLDYDKEKLYASENRISSTLINEKLTEEVNDDVAAADGDNSEWLPHETELLKILRNPVEAVKRNLVPHICKLRETDAQKDGKRSKKMNENYSDILENSLTNSNRSPSTNKSMESSSFIGKLLEDPMLQQVAEGLETETVAELIENSLKRLQDSRSAVDMSGTKDNEDMNRLIDISLKKLKEERNSGKDTSSSSSLPANGNLLSVPLTKEEERLSNRGSISSANSFASAHNYELFDFEAAIDESDCYQSCSSDVNSLMEDDPPSAETKSKFYQMLVDATLQEIELSTNIEDSAQEEHQYESIRHTIDPIYEEISDVPPPLPLTAPPLNDPELEKKSARSIFEGASKYDILSYLVDAKERGLVKEEPFDYPLNCSNPIIIEEESSDTLSDLGKLSKLKRIDTISSRSSIMSDSSDDNQSSMSSLSPPSGNNFMLLRSKQATSDIERNDSGVGSETSKSSRSKYLSNSNANSFSLSPSLNISQQQPRSSPLHLCEDCDGTVETQISENGHVFAPLVCRKCGKKRVERKEIITEVVETEEKYGRDLQIILEEFCHPMLVAGLLTQEQLSAIFLNTEELLENNQTLAERMRDALDIALEQGDDDLLTVNIGKIFLDSTQMLHAFESYCVRQAGASLLLANLEKDKELLRIFLKVSQMENAVLRRMNLNSFLMVSFRF